MHEPNRDIWTEYLKCHFVAVGPPSIQRNRASIRQRWQRCDRFDFGTSGKFFDQVKTSHMRRGSQRCAMLSHFQAVAFKLKKTPSAALWAWEELAAETRDNVCHMLG